MQTAMKHTFLNLNHVSDNNYSIQLIRWFLKPIGVWPKSGTTTKAERIVSTILMILCFLAIIFPVITCALYAIMDEEEMQIKILNAIGPMSFWLMTSIKMVALIYHGSGIRQCLDYIEVDWCNVAGDIDREIMLNSAKVGRYLATTSMVFMHGGVYLYDVACCLTTIVKVVGNQSVKARILPVPFYEGIIDTRYSPAYEIIFAAQCFSSFAINQVTTGACSLAVIFVMHACGQLRIIMGWLKSLADKNVNFQQKQADVVEHHLRTLSFIAKTEDVMNQICFLDITFCTVDMCLLAYYLLTEWEKSQATSTMAYLTMLISLAYNIFIFCYVGEILSEECRLVGESAYMTKWYKLPAKASLSFILIISRSRLVMKITAGKLFQLSLTTFSNVMKTSFAYLNILRQVT